MKTKLIPTQNDLREKTRRAMIELLNQQLADVLDLSFQAKQAHWNVKGPHSRPWKLQFRKPYTASLY